MSPAPDRLATIRAALPGLAVAFGVALMAQQLATALGGMIVAPGAVNPISPVAAAVVLGLLLGNTVGTPAVLTPGIAAAVRHVLRWGIVLVGLKLSIVDVLQVGATGVPVISVLLMVAAGTALGIARLLGVSATLGGLAAVSTAICGITATVAVAPAIGADDREVAYTVANVTLLGLFGMLVYPFVAHGLFADHAVSAGLFLGTAIHDTSQVMGAAVSYGQLYGDTHATDVATVTKLTRNLFLVVAVPLMGWAYATPQPDGARRRWTDHVPGFVLAFAAMAVVRTLGDISLTSWGGAFGLLDSDTWSIALKLLGSKTSTLFLGTALAAVGLKTRLSVLAGLGPRPLVVAFGAAAAVTLTSIGISGWAGGAW